MAKGQMNFIELLLAASVIVFAASIIWFLGRTIKNKRAPEKWNKAGVSSALVFSGFLIISIWLLRFAVGYFAIVVSENATQLLTPPEELINSLFGALRTFSMEEDYAEYIINLKALLSEIIPDTCRCFSVIKTAMVLYASLLNLIAPIVGGAIILEILASIFPKVRLRCLYLSGHPKCFFSELNAASLALAKSIFEESKEERPIFIFTDTYVDDENEKEYELLLEAKKYGAICVRDDLIHVSKPVLGTRKYYLMDANEFGNMQTLMGLTEDRNVKYIKNSFIYLFVQSDAYVQIEKQVNKELESEKKQKLLKGGEKPVIVPVHSCRNLVHNLFVDIPLYEPLINKKDNSKLNVTILGNGLIGTEAFFSAYWFGQMLIGDSDTAKTMSGCDMTINVVSKDTEDVFWSKIGYVNSEIKETVRVLGKHKGCDKSKLLEYDSCGNLSDPYCNVRYIKADVKVGGFWDGDSEEAKELLDSDYFIIALGNDADNISVADKLRCLIGKKHLEEKQADEAGNVIIAYAVFDAALADSLNNNKYYRYRVKEESDIYMYAFGSVEQVYSCGNVYMSKHTLLAEGTGAAYDKAAMYQKHIADNKERKIDENKNYNYWSDLARAMHIKYKVFSLGLIKKSLFDYGVDGLGLYNDYIEQQFNIYKQIALAQSPEDLEDKLLPIYADFQLKRHMLAWLEHRRWIAFTRTMGYRYTSEFKKNLILNGKNHKNMELKLHPCLTEAKKPEMNGENIYLQEQLQSLFVEPLSNFKVDNLELTEMISLLCERKECLLTRLNAVLKIDKQKLDLLDKLTCEWCEEATRSSLVKIDEVLKTLQATEFVSKEIKNMFLAAWNGVYCYDFKKYDYYEFDFNEE